MSCLPQVANGRIILPPPPTHCKSITYGFRRYFAVGIVPGAFGVCGDAVAFGRGLIA